MENEVSNSVSVAVSLIGIGALLVIVAWVVMLGQDMEGRVVEKVADVKSNVTVQYIDDLVSGRVDNEMPSAAAFNILTTYEKVISSTICGICGEEVDLLTGSSCIGKHMNGRVQLEVIEKDKVYNVIIHKGDCNWKVGNCTCANRVALDKFRTNKLK